jgi:hypothetical protein
MVLAVSCRLLISKAPVRTRVRICGICDGQSGNGPGFSPSHTVYPVAIIPPWLTILVFYLGDE